MQAPDARKVNPEADTLTPDTQPLHTSTPLSSSFNKVNAPNTAPATATKKSQIPKILTAIGFSVAAALGAHKCVSANDNPEAAQYSVASSLSDAEKIAKTLIESNPDLPKPKNANEALRNFIKRNKNQLTSEEFEESFTTESEKSITDNKYIQVMILDEATTDEGDINHKWSPVTGGIAECIDPTWCIFAVRARKDRYRGLISFRKQHKPDAIWRDEKDPNIIYAGFNKPGFSSINVLSPGNPNKNLFLTRIAIRTKERVKNSKTEE